MVVTRTEHEAGVTRPVIAFPDREAPPRGGAARERRRYRVVLWTWLRSSAAVLSPNVSMSKPSIWTIDSIALAIGVESAALM